jgi:hypothetical protein
MAVEAETERRVGILHGTSGQKSSGEGLFCQIDSGSGAKLKLGSSKYVDWCGIAEGTAIHKGHDTTRRDDGPSWIAASVHCISDSRQG